MPPATAPKPVANTCSISARIALPPERRELSRKSVALYFYTRERPADEVFDAERGEHAEEPGADALHGATDAGLHPRAQVAAGDPARLRRVPLHPAERPTDTRGDIGILDYQVEVRGR